MKRRVYKVWILLIPTNAKHFWEWSEWMKLFEILKPLVSKTRGNKVLDVSQTRLDVSQTRKKFRPMNESPMAWTEKNMEKWTHNSPLTAEFTSHLSFNRLELSCPSYETCEKEETRPDVYLSLTNKKNLDESPCGIANQILLMAVATDFLPIVESSMELLPAQLHRLTKPVLFVELTSPWVYKKDHLGTSELSLVREFFKKDWDWNCQPTVEMFDTQGARYEIDSWYDMADGDIKKELNFKPTEKAL